MPCTACSSFSLCVCISPTQNQSQMHESELQASKSHHQRSTVSLRDLRTRMRAQIACCAATTSTRRVATRRDPLWGPGPKGLSRSICCAHAMRIGIRPTAVSVWHNASPYGASHQKQFLQPMAGAHPLFQIQRQHLRQPALRPNRALP
ncbi:hypothetical protein FA95DRAFT_780023 [Auriscalpium vulgare]|uniref:Uncharacterized protein n=1 Tax=Auriscalpium vulgare TaxID=40419 RepID=A0ACB8S0N3_9AGAM|nr:hypothetical protein FA95DRAFT_780023 [Auriscalpium vulgare]